MNYLFVVPRDNCFGFLTIPPGVVYVATSLKETGRNVYGIHLNYESDIEASLRKKIIDNNINVLCIGGLSDQYNEIKRTIELSKHIKPDLIIVVGGGLITAQPKLIMENIGADYAIVGQGEITICELAEALEGQIPFRDVAGILYFEDQKLVCNDSRPEIRNLDAVTMPDYDIFPYAQVPNDPININGAFKRTVNITASRSCPYNCTFCYHPSGTTYRQRSIENIFREIDFLVSKYDIEHLLIIDELFAIDENRVSEFCESIAKYDITFSVQLRVDSIDEDLLHKLKKAGCTSISYGLESADNSILKSMKKGTDISQIENALSLTRKIGFFIQGYFIFGDIEETIKTVNTTIRWWMKHLEYGINLAMIRIFPGSYLYQHAIEQSIITDEIQYIANGCPLINVSKLTDQEFAGLIKKITYLNSEFLGLTTGIEPEAINDDGSHAISVECMACGSKNLFPDVAFEYRNVNSANSFCCKTCFQKINAQPSKVISKNTYKNLLDAFLEKYFSDKLSGGKKVAIWGVTEKSLALLLGSKTLRDHVVCVVDRDYQIKNKKVLNIFDVFPPTRLIDLDFEYLVIGASGYEKDILKNLESMNVNVDVLDI